MERALPKTPKDSGFVEEFDLTGVTRINTTGVKFFINDTPVVGEKDALILTSVHILDPKFKKMIAEGRFIGAILKGDIAWNITRQIGLGAELVSNTAAAPKIAGLSMARPSAAAATSNVRSAKAAPKPKRAAKRKKRGK
jgi:hypothetical protein